MSHCYGYTTSNIPLVKMRSLEIKNHEMKILFGGFISYKNYTTQCSKFFQKVLNIKEILSIWSSYNLMWNNTMAKSKIKNKWETVV